MKKRLNVMLWLLAVPAVLLTALGVYLKYWVLGEGDHYRDYAAAALPMILMEDTEFQAHLKEIQAENLALELPGAMPVQPILPEPTEPPTLPPETEPPETTVPETIPPFSYEVTLSDTGSWQFLFDGPRVTDAWFRNTLFIGDSRTCTLRDLARSGEADYFCKVGMSVFSVGYDRCSDQNFAAQNLESLLEGKEYDKVFISLGLNEAGFNLDDLLGKYGELVALIREKQPDAKIILQGIMTVSYGKAHSAWYFGLPNLEKINNGIKAMVDEETVYFIDVNEIFAGEDGYLRQGISGDGCHLYGKYGVVWEEWIRHAVAQLDME